MIQRKQTLFLLQVAFLAVCFLFVPVQFVNEPLPVGTSLLPGSNAPYASSTGHLAAVALNALGLLLAVFTIFVYKRRELQVKLCYVIMVIYVILPLMIALCPFTLVNGNVHPFNSNVFAYIISAVNILAAFLAARFVKKDIQLLKSADRIR